MIHILSDIVVILALASAVLVICHRLHIPSILGFILTGILIGPHGLELVAAADQVEVMAEIGVVLLLFTIGLEVSVELLWQMRRPALLGGALQVVVTTLGGFALFSLLGGESRTALFAGFFIAVSSTAMVLKLLQERGEALSPHGQASLGFLLFQDVSVVPMMLIIPALAGSLGGSGTAIGGQLLKAMGVLILLGGARWLVPRLLYLVVRTRNREVFALSVIVVCLAIAWLTEAAGLSLALGAFIAGVIISESEFSHDALATVLPFKHIFASMFFISIGMLMDINFVLQHWLLVLPVFSGVVVLKALIVFLVLVLLKHPRRTAVLTALAIAQVGEFSFVLLQSASDHGLVSEGIYQLLLVVALLSLAVTPFLMNLGAVLAPVVGGPVTFGRGTGGSSEFAAKAHSLKDHLIIAGYGVGGKNVARAARSCGIPYVILEINAETVRSMRREGESIRYGDAVNEAGLSACGIERARVMVVAISDPAATRRAIAVAKKLNPAVQLIARTRYTKELPSLVELGADQVIPEEFETSIEIFTRVLAAYLVPRADIEGVASEIRSEGYQMLRKPGSAAFSVRGAELTLPDVEISAFRVEKGSVLENLTLTDAQLRQRYRVTVLALRRGETTTANPASGKTIRSDDVLIIMGTVNALADVAELFRSAGGNEV